MRQQGMQTPSFLDPESGAMSAASWLLGPYGLLRGVPGVVPRNCTIAAAYADSEHGLDDGDGLGSTSRGETPHSEHFSHVRRAFPQRHERASDAGGFDGLESPPCPSTSSLIGAAPAPSTRSGSLRRSRTTEWSFGRRMMSDPAPAAAHMRWRPLRARRPAYWGAKHVTHVGTMVWSLARWLGSAGHVGGEDVVGVPVDREASSR
jgi:hypothetical protein